MFDFFKKKKVIEVEAEVKSIPFGEIEGWIEKKVADLRGSERDVLGEISGKLDGFYVSLEEKLGVLESVDIEGKKDHERAKILVRQGLDKYTGLVRVLLKELTKISSPLAEGFDLKNRKGSDSKNPEKFSFAVPQTGMTLVAPGLEGFAKDVSEVFALFEKASFRFYERATYLVGDEMAAVRNEIRKFYNGLVETFEGSLIKDLKTVGNVKLKLGEFDDVGNSVKEVRDEISVNDLKIEKTEKSVKILEDEIGEIRKSGEYVSGMKAREEIKGLRVGLDKEIVKLKELIDFKRLTNLVHSNERELGVVKDYKAHFLIEFSKDNGERLFGLMEGTNMKNVDMVARVDLISGLRDRLSEKVNGIGKDYTVEKLREIEKIKEGCENIELDNIKINRRLEELGLKLKGLKNEALKLVNEF